MRILKFYLFLEMNVDMYRIIRRFFIKQKIKRVYARLEDGFIILKGDYLLGLREKGEKERDRSEDEKAKWIGYVNAINEIIRYADSNK